MSENLNRDPMLRSLARFTPSGSIIDRDALLFAAGRAAAPRGRRWRVVAVVLAATQTLTLILWLTGPRPAAPPAPSPARTTPATEPMPAGSYGELVRRWEHGEPPPPPPVEDPTPVGPTLTVASRAGLNIE